MNWYRKLCGSCFHNAHIFIYIPRRKKIYFFNLLQNMNHSRLQQICSRCTVVRSCSKHKNGLVADTIRLRQYEFKSIYTITKKNTKVFILLNTVPVLNIFLYGHQTITLFYAIVCFDCFVNEIRVNILISYTLKTMYIAYIFDQLFSHFVGTIITFKQ